MYYMNLYSTFGMMISISKFNYRQYKLAFSSRDDASYTQP